MKILMAAPFEVKGRYQGGISSIVNSLIQREDYLLENDLEIVRYETCRIERSKNGSSKLSFSNFKNFFAIYFSLPKEIKIHEPQILYFHSSVKLALLKDLLAIRHAKKKTSVRTVLHIHFAEYEKIMTGQGFLDKMILHILKNYVDRIVFLSKSTAEEFVAHGIDEGKTQVIYNFSTVEFSKEEQEASVESINEKCRFLFVGSIDKRKGICDLLECFMQIHAPKELHICGGYSDDAMENEVKEYIQRLGDSVVEHGYVSGEEKRRIYLDIDVLVLPSYGEGLPMVIMEAYHAGCAVISTSVGAIPEVLGKDNGFIIQPGDREQLLIAMERLIEDPKLLKQMKKLNAEMSVDFTLKKFTHDIADVCRELI